MSMLMRVHTDVCTFPVCICIHWFGFVLIYSNINHCRFNAKSSIQIF